MLEELTSLTNILIIISIILNITIIVMISKGKSAGSQNTGVPTEKVNTTFTQKSGIEVGVVFCRNCGQQYESTSKACPNCKTARGA
ncbi:hypothetical protein [Ornithinibacillus halotolerans]|uniref:Uncharacterized protein n=1 Tax=Ornithinibacillus halotolerans TaxID=1274357 RepID=A0A916S1Q6_9BACI|nr:hypothetical protein [Ornithinibacillus halotolerans]GGA79644.1 hypothetical protein GCM10008025_23800 [Ornithinibacillus halotolerans]